MHDVLACRHIDPATRPDVSETRLVLDTPCHAFTLVRDPAGQELAATASRQLRHADDFLAAARHMVNGGYHPKAGPTTLRLAAVFAGRMKRSGRGHFPFSAETTARELGLGKRAVMYHARYLRELGLLAYVEHGSKTNVLRTRRKSAWQPGDGYRGTATLFAAVAPRAWDDAMGRRISGTGYTAHVCGVTEAGRARAIEEARRRASSRRPSCTPSVVVPQDHRHLKVERSGKYTSRKRATRTTAPPHTSRIKQPPLTVSPAECARRIAVAEQLKREVWWLNRGCPRRLAYALRPLISAGWTWQSLAAELLTWGVPRHLRDPAAYVRYELVRRQTHGVLRDLPPPAGNTQVDDDGARHAAMLLSRQERQAPIWRRYAQQLRPALHRRLAEIRDTGRQPQLVDRRPWLRESEEAFAQALALKSWEREVSPLEVYRARALGQPFPIRRPTPDADLGWAEYLRNQQEAERACAALRTELEEWEYHRAQQHL
ncbi:hypothetical protein AB0H07_46755 [Streptomyces sp. NPDC021354]|uniref:hypothetical protein n=1 Tax=Streptomyces sp. NPDC021354 TaxID=3154793 RepID=UPI0033F84CCF